MANILNNPNFKVWFGNSKVVDANGNPLQVYHGTQRPDRIGVKFDPKRATSGPMAYFTDDPDIASGYANNKSDTSLGNEEDYKNRFMVKVRGLRNSRSVFSNDFWWMLPQEKRDFIKNTAPYITMDDQNNIYLDETHSGGLKSLDSYQWDLKYEAKGFPLLALYGIWLESGELFGQEQKFLEVLKLLGIEAQYNDPYAKYPGVYAVFLRIQNPLYTNNIPQDLLQALISRSKYIRTKNINGMGVDSWDKNARNPKVWIQELQKDIENGTTLSWTSIPDWVTMTLKEFSYDGIIDTGGKHGGNIHTVYIPFKGNQVKSTIGNNGNYSLESDKITESVHSDVGANRESMTIWKKILDFLMTSKPQINSMVFSLVTLKEGVIAVLELQKIVKGMTPSYIVFCPYVWGNDHGIRAAYGSYKKRPAIIMYISSSKTYTDVAQRFYFYKKEFVHEYIHFLDEVRQKPTYKPVYSSQYDTALGFNYKDYFNSAKEFNAYYTEGLNFIHDATLALAKGKRQDIWFKWYPDFETFLKSKSQSFDQEFIKALNTKNLKRMTNRLYNYYMWVCDKWKNYNPNR